MPSLASALANLELARARHRPWRPWRSPQESRVIRHMAWNWFTCQERGWSGHELARWLGVRWRYIQKLSEEFQRNPARMLREERESGFWVPTFEDLREAREETRRMAERNQLRPLRRSRWGELKPEYQKRLMRPSSFRIPPVVPVWATPVYSIIRAQASHSEHCLAQVRGSLMSLAF